MDDINAQIYNQPEKAKKFLSAPKIIFAILGMIILAEVVYAVRVLMTPSPAPVISLPIKKPAAVTKEAGKISLTAAKASFKVNEVIPVAVIVDTAGHGVSGVDLVVKFDPKVLDIDSSGLVRGKIFNEYPLISADNKTGLIFISGISNAQNSFKGKGQFAQINLKAKSLGKTSLAVDFKKGSTTDSNLVETNTSKNILETVDNLELNIQ